MGCNQYVRSAIKKEGNFIAKKTQQMRTEKRKTIRLFILS